MKKNYLLTNLIPTRLLASGVAMTLATSMFAQSPVITGTVKDETGEPIIGATVKVKGTDKGAVTDINGKFTVSATKGQTLQFSYVGMSTTTAVVGNKPISITLKEDAVLNDVVVVGYGVQKKSVVTAAIAKVDSKDLEGRNILRADDALKGLAAGVQVTSVSGQPGEAPRVVIRGNTSINQSEPLYVIDGFVSDKYAAAALNPSEIESMEVLKDAASAAIYGARGGNGVILITTKQGEKGNAKIEYNATFGWQNAARHRDVTGATDYAVLQNEKLINGGQAPLYADPYGLVDANGNDIVGFGTDWQSLVFNNNAPIVSHDVSATGGTDRGNYRLSLGYVTMDGIVGGNYNQSNYDRLTLGTNAKYVLIDDSKERTFLNKLTVTAGVKYMKENNVGITTNSTWGSVLGSALYLAPTLPVTLQGSVAQKMIDQYPSYDLIKDANGNPYTVPGFLGSYNEQNNPMAMLHVNPRQNYAHKFLPKFAAELQVWDNIKYFFTYGSELSFWGNDGAVKQLYYLSGNSNSDKTSASAERYSGHKYQIENYLTYDKTFGKHTVGAVVGMSYTKNSGNNSLGGSRFDLVNVNKPSINYATGDLEFSKDAEGNITGGTVRHSVWGGNDPQIIFNSYFGRVSYNYDEKYMILANFRRDGSSLFGPKKRYGFFPSVSAGWNIHNEDFMADTKDWLSRAKIRFSYGQNGSDQALMGIPFSYTSLTTMGATSNYYFGKSSQLSSGSKAERYANEYVQWESVEQTDLGLDLGFFDNALTFTFDYFVKNTNNMIKTMVIPSYAGENPPMGNVGLMRNTGFEVEAGYKFMAGPVNMSVKGNATYIKNKLIDLGNATGFENYGISQFSGGGTRAQNGQPFPYFYGYKTDGVFQNMDEVNAYKNSNGGLIQPAAEPGDLRFVDVNGDGQITTDDRTNIGNPNPKWSFGLILNAEWKGFDFSVFFQGVADVDVFDATYRQDIASGNFPTWVLSRWTGEGTSNKVPKLKQGDATNWQVSDLYVNDASYFRLKNIQLGYTLPKALTSKARISRLRLFVMADNLFTWTKYHGFDPEVGAMGAGTAMGVDYGIYPQARSFNVGFNLAF